MPRDRMVCLLLLVATLTVYGQVVRHEFVNLDDDGYVYENSHVQAGLTGKGVVWAFSTMCEGNWHPVTWLSHMLDCELFGLNAGYHHLVSVFLHILNSLLLYVILRRMTKRAWRSGMVAALFALHPLHVESVAWISERKDVLSTLFFMLTLWAYGRYAECPSSKRYVPVFGFLALGLMAKPMLVTVPFVLLLLDYWPLGRFRFVENAEPKRALVESSKRRQRADATVLRLIVEKLPLFILAATSSVVTLFAQKRGGAMSLTYVVPLSSRLTNALTSYAAYIYKMLWPWNLAAYYPFRKALPTVEWTGAGLILIGISVFAIRGSKRWRYVAVGWFWYIVTLLPVIGLVQVGAQSMADRYTYVPLIGLFIPVVWGIADLAANRRYGPIGLRGSAAIVILTCIAGTWIQVRHWQTGRTLFEHTLKVTEDNALAHNNLANLLMAKGNMEQAISHYEEAVRILPQFAEARYNLALALAEQGFPHEAIAQYRETLRHSPEYADAYNNLGAMLDHQGNQEEAIEHFRRAVRIDPYHDDAHYNLGVVLAKRNKQEEAIAQYQETLRIKPEYADAHHNLGLLLTRGGNEDEAIPHFRRAVRLDFERPAFHISLAVALANRGDLKEAMGHYGEAIRLNSADPRPYNNLAWTLATHPNPELREGRKAVELAEQACNLLGYKDPDFLDTLAAAYAEAGRFSEAISTSKEAISLAESTGLKELALDYEKRLQRYKHRRAYREALPSYRYDESP